MAKLDDKQREKMPKGEFAYVDKQGEGHLPIHDEEHIRNAMARWNQTHFESPKDKEEARKKILNAARRHGIEISDDDKIKKAA
jgi:hypothetical protein